MPVENLSATPARSIGRGIVERYRTTFDGDASYPTGGYQGTLQLLRDDIGREVTVIEMSVIDGDGYTLSYDPETDLMKIYRTGGANAAQEEVPDTTDLQTLSAIVVFNVR